MRTLLLASALLAPWNSLRAQQPQSRPTGFEPNEAERALKKLLEAGR